MTLASTTWHRAGSCVAWIHERSAPSPTAAAPRSRSRIEASRRLRRTSPWRASACQQPQGQGHRVQRRRHTVERARSGQLAALDHLGARRRARSGLPGAQSVAEQQRRIARVLRMAYPGDRGQHRNGRHQRVRQDHRRVHQRRQVHDVRRRPARGLRSRRAAADRERRRLQVHTGEQQLVARDPVDLPAGDVDHRVLRVDAATPRRARWAA